jgi:hypothetical protein
MSELPLEEEYLDVLQNMEASINAVYVENAALTDYEVDRALEALIKTYQGEARGKTPVPPRSPLSAQVYEAAQEACEMRMGRSPAFEGWQELGVEPVPLEVIVRCLKRIRKSIKLWTKQGGRQGYLNYIGQFLL